MRKTYIIIENKTILKVTLSGDEKVIEKALVKLLSGRKLSSNSLTPDQSKEGK